MNKIAIMGAGGFGTALSLVLSRNNHKVLLWDHKPAYINKWRAQGFSDRYPYLAEHRFPKNLTLSSAKTINAKDFDYIIISSSMEGIKNTLKHLRPHASVPIVLIQKGMLPGLISPYVYTQQLLDDVSILQFTGAAFAKDLASAAPAGMIVVYQEKDYKIAQDFAKLFRGSNIWPTLCDDVFGINIHNALRTIASFEQGFVFGYFEQTLRKEPPVSTIAITFAAISQEAKLIARYLGATKKIHDIGSKVHRVIEADLMLCQSDSSRNFALGHYMGKGLNLESAQKSVTEGVSECIPNILAIHQVLLDKIAEIDLAQRFPYLAAAYKLLNDGLIKDEMTKILAHHESYVT